MRVGDIRVLTGPNVYSHRPVLSMRLYLDDLAGKESREFPGFNELLLELLPGLAKHHCCMGREGGFAERLPRDDIFVDRAGRVAARGFERIIIREDSDLRGRRRGEIADLLRRAVMSEAPGRDCRVMLDEITVMRMAIEEIEPGDVVVIFYDKLDLALSLLEQFGAKPAQSVPRPVYSAESFLQSATGREAEGRRGK